MVAQDDQFACRRRLDQDEADGRSALEFVWDPGSLRMDPDPIIPGRSSERLDRDFLDPFGCEPLAVVVIIFDPDSEKSVPLLPFDAGYHGHD